MRINLKNYTATLILLLANLFGGPDNRNESVLIFQINNSIAPLDIFNNKKNLVNYKPLNDFLINNNAIKIKKWSKFATVEDVYNEVHFSMIYTVFFNEGTIISNVKNQGRCGSCWSFSATGSIEAIHAIKTGKLLNISEQNLVDCSVDYGNKGCQGGSMEAAFKYVIDNGLCSEKSYPYTGVEGNCMDCDPIINISSYRDIIPNHEEIPKLIVHQQPVSVAIQANLRSFQLYSSGVYSDPSCGTKLDHGVLIVGYGHVPFSEMDYWIVKNSWGPNWGENGYIRIQRNIDQESGLCGIAMQPSIPIN